MKKKLTLDVAGLSVSSFLTSSVERDGPGTVRAHDAQPTPPAYIGCTCAATCDCPSAYYWCGDGYHTLYSCDYTKNESCVLSRACTTS
jgi:hypothetical protein